jgi:hypothetical protein
MHRALNDNDLLHACDRTYGKAILVSGLSGLGIGCFWFLCVAFRAGVLS